MKLSSCLLGATALCAATAVHAADLEVTHWWTSPGEAAAVAEFARVFEEQTGNTWVDSALAGSGTGAMADTVVALDAWRVLQTAEPSPLRNRWQTTPA